MAEGSQLAPIQPQEAQDKPSSFAQWLKSTVDLYPKVFAFALVVLFIVGSIFFLHAKEWVTEKDLNRFLDEDVRVERAILALFQAIACYLLALIISDTKPQLRTSRIPERREWAEEIRACKVIQQRLVWIYYAFSFYYAVTWLRLLSHNPHNHKPQAFDVFLMTLNSVQGGLLFLLYLDLAEPKASANVLSVSESDLYLMLDMPSGETASEKGNLYAAGFQRAVCVGVFAIIVVPAWYCYFQTTSIPGFEIASACLTGVALALVIGRLGLLESWTFKGAQRIGPGALAMGFLYFYAVIQPVAASFAENPRIQVLATTAALPLKVLLWLVGIWALNTGILAEYVHGIVAEAGWERRQGED